MGTSRLIGLRLLQSSDDSLSHAKSECRASDGHAVRSEQHVQTHDANIGHSYPISVPRSVSLMRTGKCSIRQGS